MGTITCELQASYAATAGDDKANLGGKLGTNRPHKQQSWLTFAGNGKGKGRRLGDGGAQAGSWYSGMFLRRRTNVAGGGGGGMQIFVRTLAGRSLALHVSPSDTVDALKARVQAKERVAAGDQRLVFAGRDLDDGRCTLAEYGVRKEANLFLHLRLRGGAGGGAAGGGGCGSRLATVVGVLATVVAVGAALAYLPAAAAGTGGLALASLLLAWALAMAGVNLVTAGVFLTGRAETLCCTVQSVLSKPSAFVRRNLGVLGVAAASSAATGVIFSAADRVLCFVSFALLLAAMSLVVIGVASCASS